MQFETAIVAKRHRKRSKSRHGPPSHCRNSPGWKSVFGASRRRLIIKRFRHICSAEREPERKNRPAAVRRAAVRRKKELLRFSLFMHPFRKHQTDSCLLIVLLSLSPVLPSRGVNSSLRCCRNEPKSVGQRRAAAEIPNERVQRSFLRTPSMRSVSEGCCNSDARSFHTRKFATRSAPHFYRGTRCALFSDQSVQGLVDVRPDAIKCFDECVLVLLPAIWCVTLPLSAR